MGKKRKRTLESQKTRLSSHLTTIRLGETEVASPSLSVFISDGIHKIVMSLSSTSVKHFAWRLPPRKHSVNRTMTFVIKNRQGSKLSDVRHMDEAKRDKHDHHLAVFGRRRKSAPAGQTGMDRAEF